MGGRRPASEAPGAVGRILWIPPLIKKREASSDLKRSGKRSLELLLSESKSKVLSV